MSLWDRLFGRRRSDVATCREVRKVIQSYLDGELDDVSASRVERHLEACRRCGLNARTYRAVKRELQGMAEPTDQEALRRLQAFAEGLAKDGET